MVRILYNEQEREEMEKAEKEKVENKPKPKRSIYTRLRDSAVRTRAKTEQKKEKFAEEKKQWAYALGGPEGVIREYEKQKTSKKTRMRAAGKAGRKAGRRAGSREGFFSFKQPKKTKKTKRSKKKGRQEFAIVGGKAYPLARQTQTRKKRRKVIQKKKRDSWSVFSEGSAWNFGLEPKKKKKKEEWTI